MTVHDAFMKLCERFGADTSFSFLPSSLSAEEVDRFMNISHWLHKLSGDNMLHEFGPDWGWHPKLPDNIDEATMLSPEEIKKFNEWLK